MLLGGVLVAERHLRRGPSPLGHHPLGRGAGSGRHGAGEVVGRGGYPDTFSSHPGRPAGVRPTPLVIDMEIRRSGLGSTPPAHSRLDRCLSRVMPYARYARVGHPSVRRMSLEVDRQPWSGDVRSGLRATFSYAGVACPIGVAASSNRASRSCHSIRPGLPGARWHSAYLSPSGAPETRR